MLTVHHLENSRSHRVLWLLEELELDYDITRYERDPETMLSPPELRAIHPLGKSPVITDGDHTIAESGAILEYVLDEYGEGRLRPAEGTEEYLSYRYWMHYAEGSAMPPLLLKLVFSQLPERAPWLVRPLVARISKMVNASYVDPQLDLHMNFWEAELEESAYFAGEEFSAADIQMSYPLEAAVSRGTKADAYPRINAQVSAFRQRPAYQRALDRSGDDSALP